jgi:starch phosphorylase
VNLWRRTEHNPVKLLHQVTDDRLEKLSRDPDFLKQYQKLLRAMDRYLHPSETIVTERFGEMAERKVAYFSAEYGLHGSLPIYSGGLGILAGDHCKAASDLGLDLTAVGFMYPRGYFEQRITATGDQEAEYREIGMKDVAIERAYLPTGEPIVVALPLENPDDLLHLQVWLVRCGRVRIYLMDSNLDLNQPWNREISTRLYGGDQQYRLRQEIALGIGGVRVLRALGTEPNVWHANEGHVAFMLLERLREAVASGLSFEEAKNFVRKHTIFTTHTPVPAGHDAFPFDMIERYFWHFWPQLGIEKEQFFDLGRHGEPWGEAFNMTTLSMNLAENRNAVSVRHGEVTREMWPEYSKKKGDIKSVTNGVHVPTWLSPEMERLFTRELGREWIDHIDDEDFWKSVRGIPDEAVWRTRQQLKTSLFSFITDRVRRKWLEGGHEAGGPGMDPALFVPSGMLLDPSILTIGFARRFATYKRATLLFKDLDRLKRLLTDPLRPVQFVFSGKAHPADEGGKNLIREIHQFAKDPAFEGRLAFVENYSMHVAKYLVRGVDVWMNNPKAPLEASGTSGMKAAINGVPNFSILDGWWIEGWNGKNGWGIEGALEGSPEEQDTADATHMYEVLEKQIVPLFYDKDIDGIPHKWIEVVKESIATILPRFAAERMVAEYIETLYLPASK